MEVRSVDNKVEFCVVGHSRSGTGYMSVLLSCLGYRVGHEEVQTYGISSWLWAVNSPIVPFGHPRANMGIHHLIQIVRDPWRVISSLITGEMMSQRVTGFMKNYIYIDTTADQAAQAAYMIVGWNRLIQAQDPGLVLQVEKAVEVLPGWLQKRGYLIPPRYYQPPSDYNTKPRSCELGHELMSHWPRGLLLEFRDHYQQYGYPIPDLLSKLTE